MKMKMDLRLNEENWMALELVLPYAKQGPDLAALPTKHVIDRLVPVLAIGHAVLLAQRGREL